MIDGNTVGVPTPLLMQGGTLTDVSSPDAGAGYPRGRSARDRFVLARRGSRPFHDAWRHQGVLVEPERAADGRIATTATVFLTGRECPWRCVMCDLWQHTIAGDTPRGAIPTQIAEALQALPTGDARPTVIKLYNAGSFFDRRAVPPYDIDAIVEPVATFDRVIVESHPSLVGNATWHLRDALDRRHPGARLEVAIGLETANPDALDRINKGVDQNGIAKAARALIAHDVDVRMFVLVHPPFVPQDEQDAWLARSIDFAFDCGSTAVTLIPTRPGEGALQALADEGLFVAPTLADLERAAAIGLAHARGRVFIDTWDLDRLTTCNGCAETRADRLRRANLEQALPDAVSCPACGEGHLA